MGRRRAVHVLAEYVGEGHGAMREAVDEESFVFTLEEVQHDHRVYIPALVSILMTRNDADSLLKLTMPNVLAVEQFGEVVQERMHNERAELQGHRVS